MPLPSPAPASISTVCPAPRQLLDADREHGHAVLVRLDLLGHADDHRGDSGMGCGTGLHALSERPPTNQGEPHAGGCTTLLRHLVRDYTPVTTSPVSSHAVAPRRSRHPRVLAGHRRRRVRAGHRRRLFADAPPPLLIDLADEATQLAPTFWTVYRGDQKVGRLGTRMKYDGQDDTFLFVSTYSDLKMDFDAGKLFQLAVHVPNLETAVTVGRAGDLRAQTMKGKLTAKLGGVPVATATAEVNGLVTNGMLIGQSKLDSPLGSLNQPLEPTRVPSGQVLNPLLPVNRLQDVRPGRRWVIREVDPLKDAIEALVRQVAKQSDLAAGLLPPGGQRRELVAVVLADPESIPRPENQAVSCWVIEYRGEDVAARTWVSRQDGRVLRQEATGFGERLRFERED